MVSMHFFLRCWEALPGRALNAAASAVALPLVCALACALGGCADRGNPGPTRTTSAPSMDGPVAGRASKPRPAASDVGLGRPEAACSGEGKRACWKHGSKLALVCTSGVWEVSTICDDDQRCDTEAGPTLGTCRPIAEACVDQEAGRGFCAGDALRTCVDLVSFYDDGCGEGSTCSDASGEARCTCKAGYTGEAGACSDVDECAINGGGCDEGAPCENTDGAFTCGGCPPGYIGGAEGTCTPALTSLVAGPTALTPEFETVRTKYVVNVPITVTTVTLKATAPKAATISIEGTPMRSGKTWRSGVLPPGETKLAITLSEEGHPERKYQVRVKRGTGEATYLKASNAGSNDNFGASVALSGDSLVIGAPREDSAAVGVDGAADNNAASAAGAAYVYVKDDKGWKQQAYLKASNTAAGAGFGAVVAISGDTVAVGAPNEASSTDAAPASFGSGAVYIFTRERGKWTQQAMLKASNAGPADYFGSSVALADDTLVVGAPGEGSNATGINGAQDNNAAPGSGAVYVLTRQEGVWTQSAYLKPAPGGAGDAFGFSVALDGDTVVVGATGEDSDARGIDGDALSNTAENSGAAYAFVRDEDGWFQEAYFKGSASAAGDSFGYSVAISGNGVVVGAPGSVMGDGRAYLFQRSGGRWAEQPLPSVVLDPMAMRTAPGDGYGTSVRLLGDLLLVGAYGEDSNASGFNGARTGNAPNSGAGYLQFRLDGQWMQSDTIKPTNTRANQQFGSRVALSADTIAIGAMNDGRDLRDLSPAQASFGPASSGAVYVFR